MTNDPMTAPTRTVIVKAGYRRERLPGNILIMRLLDSQRESLDAWYEDCCKCMSAWRPGRRLRYLHDIRHAEYITPYATERVIRVLAKMRQLPVTDGRGAILLQTPALGSVLGTFFKRRTYANWQVQFFNDEHEAIRWLEW
ncbi:MAG: hypothetical protein IT322_13575 [Anaerolineae bacterium]|nr:hypothetical protein [Anaerolineae bacterium]CAG1002857.1 hypothetical protein ANRL4_03307 [Anaerolineae bacterium]